MIWRFYNWAWRLLPGVAAAAVIAALYQSSLLVPLERLSYRSLFQSRGPQAWDERLVLIAIDDPSLEALGRFPWPRQRYTDLLRVLAPANPSVVAINLIWSEESPDDDGLGDAIAAYGRVILAEANGADGSWLEPVPTLRAGAIASGHVLYRQAPDGMVRQIYSQLGQSLAFSLATLQAYALVQEFVPLPALGAPLALNWVGPAGTLPQYSFSDVIENRVSPEVFRDKIVLVGVTATGLDALATPFDQNSLASSVYVHATAINNGLQGAFIRALPPFVVLSGILISGPILSSILFGREMRIKLAVMMGLSAGCLLLGMAFFWQNLRLPLAPPLLLISTVTAIVSISEQIQENRLLKYQIKHLWQAYHDGLATLDNQLLEPRTALPAAVQPGGLSHRILQLTLLADQLGRSQSVQNAIACSLPIGLVAADTGDRVWFCNPTAQALLSVRPGSSLAQHLVPRWMTQQTWELAIRQLQRNTTPPTQKVLVQGQWFDVRWQLLSPPESSQGAVQLTSRAQGFLLILEDISAHKEIEATLEDAKKAAEAASLAKSEFLANMSHELRTPLNAILGFSNLMADDQTLSLAHQDYLDIIHRSGQHLLGLINNVLDMAKIEAQRMALHGQVTNLHRLLDDLYRMVSLKAKHKNLALSFECHPAVPAVLEIDDGKLRQILLNLLDNAIKFTPAGQVILRLQVESDAYLRPKDKLRLQFEIIDTGEGIAAEDIPQIFQPFRQADANRQVSEGTGLGLAISQQFVRLMGGDLTVESIPKEGSAFRFTVLANTVPSETAPEPPSETPMVSGLSPAQKPCRVLVVEDQPDNRKLLSLLLKQAGFQVWVASNGVEGLAQVTLCRPDAILIDIRMPVMNGDEVIRTLRSAENGQSLVIIAVTSSGLKEDYEQLLASGCDDVIRKPIQTTVLFGKLASHLGLSYTYRQDETLPPSSAVPSALPSPTLQPEHLRCMPATWLAQLETAASECRDSKIHELLEQIPEHQTLLLKGLKQLTDNFQFDKILQLIPNL